MANPESTVGHFPDLEAAILEYFADVAFDTRIEKLLAGCDFSQKTFSTSTISEYEVYPDVLTHNDRDIDFEADDPVEQGVPMTRLSATGTFSRIHNKNHIDLELVSDTDPTNRLKIQSSADGGYYAYQPNSTLIDQLSLRDVTGISLLANGISKDTLARIHELGENEHEYQRILDFVWNRAADKYGIKRELAIVEKEALSSTPERPVIHRLAHHETNIADYSVAATDTIELVYELVTKHVDLEVEEVYRLYLKYESSGGTHLHQDAKKLVRNTGYDLASIAFYHEGRNRTAKQLNPKDPAVMQRFVDSFEELLSL